MRCLLTICFGLSPLLATAALGEGHGQVPVPAPAPAPAPQVLVAKPAPAFALKDLDGRTISSTNFEGKTTIVLFWASWDQPSQKQIAILNELQRAYAPAGFTVVGLSLDTRWPEAVKTYAATNSVAFPILQADFQTVKDFGGLEAIPTMIVIEPHGNMIFRYEGVTAKPALESDLKSIFEMQLK
jgi:peroxiredoxin